MRPLLITVLDAQNNETTAYEYASSPVRIGRHPDNQLVLPYPFVSGWHAEVQFDEASANLFDRGSTNGVMQGGKKIAAHQAVAVESVLSVTIGRLELLIQRGEEQKDEASNRAKVDQTGPPSEQYTAFVPAPEGAYVLEEYEEQQAAKGPPPLPAASQPLSSEPKPPTMFGGLKVEEGGRLQPTLSENASGDGEASSQASPLSRDAFPSTAPHSVQSFPSHASAAPNGQAEVEDGTAFANFDALHRMMREIRPDYSELKSRRQKLQTQVDAVVGVLPPAMQASAKAIVGHEFPDLVGGDLGTTAPAGSGVGSDQALLQLYRQLCPGQEPPQSAGEQSAFVARLQESLMLVAQAFVGLQSGQEQFARDMGVQTVGEFSNLHSCVDASSLLQYLLDCRAGGPERTAEFAAALSDIQGHPIALLKGVIEGVRALLAQLDPGVIERDVQGKWALPLSKKGSAAWKHYAERFHSLSETDKNLVKIIFGAEFCEAYAQARTQQGH